jgi:enamine deaminase RidA (YjgF/YER057c/UK114 family)
VRQCAAWRRDRAEAQRLEHLRGKKPAVHPAADDERFGCEKDVLADRGRLAEHGRIGQEERMTARRLVSSGSYLEPQIGFSRAVRVGAHIAVAGTAPIAAAGGTAARDVYGQTRRCLEIVEAAIIEAGGSLEHVTRTRIMLTDVTNWRDAARAHGEYFGSIRPACTFVQVGGFIDPAWLVEVEADAIVLTCHENRL